MSLLKNFLEKLWSKEEEYIKNLCETVPHKTLLVEVLNMIPKNMIVDLHFQEYYKHPFVNAPAQYCLDNLPSSWYKGYYGGIFSDLL